MQPPSPQPEMLAPSPAPKTIAISIEEHEGKKFVVFRVFHAQGRGVYHFPPEAAEQIAGMFAQAAVEARSGLTLASRLPGTP